MPPETNPEKINKKMIIIAVAAILALLGGAVVYKKLKAPAELSREEIIKKQLDDLNKLPQPLNGEEISQQLEKINKSSQSLSQEEINKQLEELNKSR